MTLFEAVAYLPLTVEASTLEYRERSCFGDYARISALLETQDARPGDRGFTRPCTCFSLHGKGETELSVGRQHLHALASLFYPDGQNAIAPSRYNDPEPMAGLPRSPLSPPARPRGFEWE